VAEGHALTSAAAVFPKTPWNCADKGVPKWSSGTRKTTPLSFHHLVRKSNCIAVELSIWMILLIKGLSLSIGVKNQTELHGYG